jgi:hypothetical protein
MMSEVESSIGNVLMLPDRTRAASPRLVCLRSYLWLDRIYYVRIVLTLWMHLWIVYLNLSGFFILFQSKSLPNLQIFCNLFAPSYYVAIPFLVKLSSSISKLDKSRQICTAGREWVNCPTKNVDLWRQFFPVELYILIRWISGKFYCIYNFTRKLQVKLCLTKIDAEYQLNSSFVILIY